MTDASAAGILPAATPKKGSLFDQDQLTRRRNAREARFRIYGMVAIVLSLSVLAIMLFTIFRDGTSAFRQASLSFPITLEAEILDPTARGPRTWPRSQLLATAILSGSSSPTGLVARDITVEGLTDKDVSSMVSRDAPGRLRAMVLADPALIGQTIDFRAYATGRIDGYLKGRVTMETAAIDSNVSIEQLAAGRYADRGRHPEHSVQPGFSDQP
jgi:phosphate transport system permease protein